jgi:hypothetical protein
MSDNSTAADLVSVQDKQMDTCDLNLPLLHCCVQTETVEHSAKPTQTEKPHLTESATETEAIKSAEFGSQTFIKSLSADSYVQTDVLEFPELGLIKQPPVAATRIQQLRDLANTLLKIELHT